MTFINFCKMMTFIEFDRFLKTFIDFCRVYKFIDDLGKGSKIGHLGFSLTKTYTSSFVLH